MTIGSPMIALATAALLAAGGPARTAAADAGTPAATHRNQPPVAVIGVTGSQWSSNGTRYYLTGSGSYDPDGTIVSYNWTLGSYCQTGGATNGSTLVVETTGLNAHCKVTLRVTDAQGAYDVAGFAFSGGDGPPN
jgi:hypothetical protein